MITHFRPRIRSRHPSHDILRKKVSLPLFPFKSVIRFGSMTEMPDTIDNGGDRLELNTTDAIQNSANKLLMKQCFHNDEVKTAKWWTAKYYDSKLRFLLNNDESERLKAKELEFPLVSKHIFGSRGTGNIRHTDKESLKAWAQGKDLSKYIFEKYYSYNREYRLHVNQDGCFYTCRKMLKSDTPKNERWFRNDHNSSWFLETNEDFDKPVNWNAIIEESIKALKAVGLDFGAVDLRIQSSKDKKDNVRENPEFIIIEINSAPSFGDNTAIKYMEEIPKMLMKKKNG